MFPEIKPLAEPMESANRFRGRVVMDLKTTRRNCSDFWSRLSEPPLYGYSALFLEKRIFLASAQAACRANGMFINHPSRCFWVHYYSTPLIDV